MPDFAFHPTVNGIPLSGDRLPEDSRDEADPITDWREGVSIMRVSELAAGSGWDFWGVAATVVTDRTGTTGRQVISWDGEDENAFRVWDSVVDDWRGWKYPITSNPVTLQLRPLDNLAESTAPALFSNGLFLFSVSAGANWGPNTGEAGYVLVKNTDAGGTPNATEYFTQNSDGVTYERYWDGAAWSAWDDGTDAETLEGEDGDYYLDRANHTGTQTLGTITGHDKAAHDALDIDADTLDGHDTAYFATATSVSDHLADATDAHDASAISILDTAGQYAATNAEDALAEVLDALQAHEADASDAHDASAISYAGGTGMSATNVEAAVDELATEKLNAADLTKAAIDALDVDADTLDGISSAGFATATGLSDHLSDATAAHAASAISYAGSTNVAATDVEAAIDELDTEKLAAASYTAADVLAKLLTVDGSGSGLDADLLDGNSSAAFQLLTGKDANSGYAGVDASGGLTGKPYVKFDRQTSAPATPGSNGANIYTINADGNTVLEGRTETGGRFRFLRDQLFIGRNSTGSTLAAGSWVRITGWDAVNEVVTIALADTGADATMPAAGILTAAIANGASGRVWQIGLASGLNTAGMTEGGEIYLTTSGGWTQTRPTAVGARRQFLGTVLVAHASTGSIFVYPEPSYEIIAASGGSLTLTEVEKNLGSYATRSGSFQITGLSGLTIDRPVLINQANGPYTGKGTLADEAEMDQVSVTGKTTSATTIQCYWNSPTPVLGNFKFAYAVG
jgi:hypothetical protein